MPTAYSNVNFIPQMNLACNVSGGYVLNVGLNRTVSTIILWWDRFATVDQRAGVFFFTVGID